MPVTTTTVRLPQSGAGKEDRYGQRSYTVMFHVDQTDDGTIADGAAVVIAAQTATQVPLKGATYSYDGLTDADSFLQEIAWERAFSADRQRRWLVTCQYSPAEGLDSGTISEPNPLRRPVEYWIDWTEEAVVVREARNVEDMLYADTFPRAAGTLGPVVNACGVEFTEPVMKTVFHPVLYAQKAYATLDEIVALNLTYQGTTNSATFFGGEPRTAKYLTTESGRIQRVNGQSFYMGVTRIWFKKDTWDYKILNNGWSHFKSPLDKPNAIVYKADGSRAFFRNLVYDNLEALENDPSLDPHTPCSEPLNLTLDGKVLGREDEAVYIGYRDLEEVDYSAIGIGG